MMQKISGLAFLGGLGYFLYGLAEVLQRHSSWHELATPVGASELLGVTAGAILAIGGALGLDPKALFAGDEGRLKMPRPGAGAAVLFALALAGVSSGCALARIPAGQGSAASDRTALAQAASAAELSRQSAEIVKAAQAIEIAFFKAGSIPAPTHQRVQTGFLAVATAMQPATEALEAAGATAADRRHLVGAALEALEQLAGEISALPPKTRDAIAGALAGAKALLTHLQLAA